tara:strand:- start:5514 stop:6614 length:1101 start_codon:yes stop_codon:yes gene_type:complete
VTAKNSACLSPIPKFTFFTEPVLRVLGRRTQFRPNVVVKLDDALRAEILTEAGLDPNHLPDHWVATRKSKTPAGIDTNIATAYRFLHHHTHQGRNGQAWGLQLGRNKWGLTELGVTEARRLTAPNKRKPKRNKANATSLWLTKHLTPEPGSSESKLLRMMKAAVAKKCPVSASMGQIEDHVQGCFLRLIRRDSIGKLLAKGRNVTYTHIATYAVRSAYTDVRDAGTEPLLRERLGARTEKERRDRKAAEAVQEAEGTPAKVLVYADNVELSAGRELVEVMDPSAPVSDMLAERLSFEKMWGRLQDAMKQAKPHAYNRYVGILRMQILEGRSVKEIAEVEGVSPFRAATMLQEARRAVRNAGRPSLG